MQQQSRARIPEWASKSINQRCYFGNKEKALEYVWAMVMNPEAQSEEQISVITLVAAAAAQRQDYGTAIAMAYGLPTQLLLRHDNERQGKTNNRRVAAL